MISRRLYNIRGIILVDIIMAFSLSLVFILAITEASTYSRDIFERAKDSDGALDAYEANLLNGRGESVIRPYGNEREEAVTRIERSIADSLPILFSSVRIGSDTVLNGSSQNPLCSVDFTDRTIVGSYDWSKYHEGTSSQNLSISVTSHPLPISPLTELTDLEVRGNFFYVSADPTSQGDPDIYVFKIQDDGTITMISSLNTGPGIKAFAIAGKYLYAAAPSTASQLHIIEQNSARSLSLLKKYQLPLPFATATPALGSGIAYSLGRIYLGTEKWAGNEFSVVDVSDPMSPQTVTGIETGGKVGDVYIHDHTLYVSGADQKQLRVVDIQDPDNISIVTDFSPSGWQRQEGKMTSVFEGHLDFGRTAGGYNVVGDHEEYSFDRSTVPIQSFDTQNFRSVDMPGGVYGIVRDRLHHYVITRQTGKEFQIFDSDMTASTSLQFSLPSYPQMMTCYGHKIYILSATSPVIYEIVIDNDPK